MAYTARDIVGSGIGSSRIRTDTVAGLLNRWVHYAGNYAALATAYGTKEADKTRSAAYRWRHLLPKSHWSSGWSPVQPSAVAGRRGMPDWDASITAAEVAHYLRKTRRRAHLPEAEIARRINTWLANHGNVAVAKKVLGIPETSTALSSFMSTWWALVPTRPIPVISPVSIASASSTPAPAPASADKIFFDVEMPALAPADKPDFEARLVELERRINAVERAIEPKKARTLANPFAFITRRIRAAVRGAIKG